MVRSFYTVGLLVTIVQAAMNATVSYDTSPITDISTGITLAVRPDVLHADSPLLNATSLQPRKAIDVVLVVSAAASAGFTAVLAGSIAIDIYKFIADKIYTKSTTNSCTLIYGTDSNDGYYEGYAYKATTTGSNCETTAIEATILSAVQTCADKLHSAGAVRGCCTFSHGGTWTGHLRLTSNPTSWPATDVDC